MTYWIDSPSTATPLSAANLNRAQQVERKMLLWKPASSIDETFHRMTAMSSQTLLTSGTLRLGGGVVLPADEVVTSITVMAGGTAVVTPTAQWFCLVRQSDLSVLMKTADDTTTAWAGLTAKTLTLSSTYTPSVEEAVWIGVVVVAGTVPTLTGFSLATSNAFLAGSPAIGANSTTGLTNPASLGATAAAVTVSGATFYATVQ